MIVVDTSVYVAILRAEPEVRAFAEALATGRELFISAANYVECTMVAIGRGLAARNDLDSWLERRRIAIAPLDAHQARIAADAFARFGKGRHPAALNYGDCFAYALARSLDAPLLFKGDDFGLTDIVPALSAG